jgi:hypothetical protein
MIITTSSRHYKTLEIATRLEAQLLREVCVISRPLIQESLARTDANVPESLRRLRRTLQDIYHGVDSICSSSRGKSFPEPLYLHVSPEEAHLLGHFLKYTSADAIYNRFDARAMERVGSLASVTILLDGLRLRWTGTSTVIGPLEVAVKPMTALVQQIAVPGQPMLQR